MSAIHSGPSFGQSLRRKFPIFADSQQHRGKPLSFLDSAASTQKPYEVINRIQHYLSAEHANVHRGAYQLSANATDAYEAVRNIVAGFIGASSPKNIIFTKGCTEAINIAAFSLQEFFNSDDCILLTILEHHSNIVPWQLLAKRKNLKIHFVDICPNGTLDLNDFSEKVKSCKPKMVAFTLLANALGTVTPFREMIEIAKKEGALVLLDAAQHAAHKDINVSELGCDFLAFSSHKLYGPTGAGALFASDAALEFMDPVYGGGDMISSVSTEGSLWAEPPQKFEAGTPAIAEVIAMGTALDFLLPLKKAGLVAFEHQVFEAFFEALARESKVEVYGPKAHGSDFQSSLITFNVKGVHPHDFATIADQFNVQVRAGHHCAQPLMKRLGLQSTARASFGVYSDVDQIEPLIAAIRQANKIFG